MKEEVNVKKYSFGFMITNAKWLISLYT